MRLVFAALLFISLLSVGSLVQGQEQPPSGPSVHSWPGAIFSRITRDLSDDWADETTRLSASLFDELANLQLFRVGDDNISVAPSIHRQVFDNRDLRETFTVADTLRVPTKITLWSNNEIPLPNTTTGLSVGAELYLQTVNLRQIPRQNLSHLEAPPDGIETRLRNLRQARYGRIWNALVFPLRLPLTEKSFERMDVGEISSWIIGGTVSFSGSFGWGNLNIVGADFLQINTGMTTYLGGTFRLSAFKIAPQKMRLKATREMKYGISGNVGQARMEYTLFEGFMVFDHNVLNIKESIVPFNFQVSREQAKTFDVVYDYDMNQPEAKRAYFLATQGRFERSHELAEQNDSGVTFILSREAQGRRHLSRAQIQLSLFFHKQSAESWSLTKAQITTQEGEYRIFEAQNINVRSFDTLWGHREERRYQFLTTLDEDDHWREKERVLNIRLDARDNNFNGRELRNLLQEITELTPLELDLPPLPTHIPCRHCSFAQTSLAWYGPGSASLEMDLPGQTLINLLEQNEEEMWPLLEAAHNVPYGQWSLRSKRFWWTIERLVLSAGNLPLFIADVHFKAGGLLWNAWRLKRHWKLAQKALNKEQTLKLARRLGRFFKERYYNRELTKLIILAGQPSPLVPTIVDISLPQAFGRVRRVSGDFPPDDLLRNISRNINFDQPGARQDFDPDLSFHEIKIERLENGAVKLSFKLERPAYYLHWHIERRQSFGRRTTLLRQMQLTPPQYPIGPGQVELIITREANHSPFYDHLASALFQEIPLAIRLAASFDGEHWGEMSEIHLDPP